MGNVNSKMQGSKANLNIIPLSFSFGEQKGGFLTRIYTPETKRRGKRMQKMLRQKSIRISPPSPYARSKANCPNTLFAYREYFYELKLYSKVINKVNYDNRCNV